MISDTTHHGTSPIRVDHPCQVNPDRMTEFIDNGGDLHTVRRESEASNGSDPVIRDEIDQPDLSGKFRRQNSLLPCRDERDRFVGKCFHLSECFNIIGREQPKSVLRFDLE
jgi:hypothetical protein